jgi:hypothetical protein
MNTGTTIDRIFMHESDDEDVDMDSLIDRWSKCNRCYSFEMDSGVRDLENLVSCLDDNYRSLHEFLADNSGAMNAIVDWIRTEGDRVQHWKMNLESALEDECEEEEEDGEPE